MDKNPDEEEKSISAFGRWRLHISSVKLGCEEYVAVPPGLLIVVELEGVIFMLLAYCIGKIVKSDPVSIRHLTGPARSELFVGLIKKTSTNALPRLSKLIY